MEVTTLLWVMIVLSFALSMRLIHEKDKTAELCLMLAAHEQSVPEVCQ